MSDYVKLHTDALDNRKIQSLPDDLLRPWINCILAARLHGGFLPDISTLAFRLRVEQNTAAGWIMRLEKAGLIDRVGDELQPHDWEYWNPPNPVDRTNAERQRRFREKKRNAVTTEEKEIEHNTIKGVTPLRNETVTSLRNAVTELSVRSQKNRFEEWIAPWSRCGDRDSALRNYISRVTPENEAAVFACRDRYLASEEVHREIVMEPWKFLMQQSNCNWSGKWPEHRNGTSKAEDNEIRERVKNLMGKDWDRKK